MKNNLVFLLGLFLISALSISAVCAAEDAPSDISSIDDAIKEDVDLKSVADDIGSDDIEDESPVLSNGLGEGNTNTDSFSCLNSTINGNEDEVISLENNFYYNKDSDADFKEAIAINRPVTINGNGFTIDANNEARVFNITNKVVINNLVFKNGNYFAGALVECVKSNCSFVNCSFVNGKTTDEFGSGGAIHASESHISFFNCSFLNNSVNYCGGAIYCSDCSVSVVNCSFMNNKALEDYGCGGAICTPDCSVSVVNCSFENNFAKSSGGAIDCSYRSNSSIVNCSFVNNKAFGHFGCGGAIQNQKKSSIEGCSFVNNYAEEFGGAIYCFGDFLETSVFNCSFVSNSAEEFGGAIFFDFSLGDNIQGEGLATNCSFNKNIANVAGGAIFGGKYINCVFSNNIAKYFGNNWINADTYEKYKTPKFVAPSVTAVYNNKKYLVVTLKDGKGDPISGVKIYIRLKGDKLYTTDKNGQVKVLVGNLVPKTYTVTLSFHSNTIYFGALDKTKVVVKKAKPKFVASAKTFKRKVKTKNYVITFKNNKNKILKNMKVSLKVNKKTYKAKTNSKGKATFKITKLTKKGTYKATISFAGNKYYNKITKKVKITVKK